jgi:hypothetical protein
MVAEVPPTREKSQWVVVRAYIPGPVTNLMGSLGGGGLDRPEDDACDIIDRLVRKGLALADRLAL